MNKMNKKVGYPKGGNGIGVQCEAAVGGESPYMLKRTIVSHQTTLLHSLPSSYPFHILRP